MNRINSRINFSIILLCFICCTYTLLSHTAIAQSEFTSYSDAKNGYDIEYIASWDIIASQYNDGGTHFVDTSSNPPQVVVNVNKAKTNQTIEAVAESTESYITEQSGASELNIVSEKNIQAAGMQGIEKLINYKINGNLLSTKIAYLAKDNDIITLTMAGSIETLGELKNEFNHMLESIKFN